MVRTIVDKIKLVGKIDCNDECDCIVTIIGIRKGEGGWDKSLYVWRTCGRAGSSFPIER